MNLASKLKSQVEGRFSTSKILDGTGYKNKGLFRQAASVKKTEKPLKLKPQRKPPPLSTATPPF